MASAIKLLLLSVAAAAVAFLLWLLAQKYSYKSTNTALFRTKNRKPCRSSASCEAHAAALKRYQAKFGNCMHLLGRLRKKGADPERHLNAADRWGWLSHRKVVAREFNFLNVTLTKLKRDREAELVRGHANDGDSHASSGALETHS